MVFLNSYYGGHSGNAFLCSSPHFSVIANIVQPLFWPVGCHALLRSPVWLAHFLLLHPSCQMTVCLPGVTQPASWLAYLSLPLSSARGYASRQDVGGDGSTAQLQNQECRRECMKLILVECNSGFPPKILDSTHLLR